MKKAALLLVLPVFLLLYGCGGSGGGITTSTQNVVPGAPTGTVSIHINTGGAQPAAVLSNYTTHLRVVVNNQNLRINNVPFKAIADTYIGGPAVIFSLPVAAGYKIEAVTYANDGTIKRVMKYALASPVAITAGTNPDVLLSLAPVQAGLILPASITSSTVALGSGTSYVTRNSYYTVMSNISSSLGRKVTPLQSQWRLAYQQIPITSATHSPYGISTAIPRTLTAPTAFTNGSMYFQGEFFIKRDLIDTLTEDPLDWTFNYPNPEAPFSDPQLSVPLVVQSGNVTIVP